MKKFFALLALAALLLTAFAFPVLAEEPILGGWSAYTDDPTEIPTEALDALNAALDGLEGCVYKPIALLGTQIVAGTNYCFLCVDHAVRGEEGRMHMAGHGQRGHRAGRGLCADHA